jgi:hypothetical protein
METLLAGLLEALATAFSNIGSWRDALVWIVLSAVLILTALWFFI